MSPPASAHSRRPNGGSDYLAVARVMGAAKVLQKPFTNAMLIAAVNELLPGETS
jgi:hypothetical protein